MNSMSFPTEHPPGISSSDNCADSDSGRSTDPTHDPPFGWGWHHPKPGPLEGGGSAGRCHPQSQAGLGQFLLRALVPYPKNGLFHGKVVRMGRIKQSTRHKDRKPALLPGRSEA